LARIFREAGVARLQPGKRPRAAWRRFVYPAPNACWQLDATEYVLTGGGKCVIFQLIDDHSRYALASHVASGETAMDAIAEPASVTEVLTHQPSPMSGCRTVTHVLRHMRLVPLWPLQICWQPSDPEWSVRMPAGVVPCAANP